MFSFPLPSEVLIFDIFIYTYIKIYIVQTGHYLVIIIIELFKLPIKAHLSMKHTLVIIVFKYYSFVSK